MAASTRGVFRSAARNTPGNAARTTPEAHLGDSRALPFKAGPHHAGKAIVIGSGIAGLTAALELGNCTLITKTALGAGASRLAQGGIAAALGLDDTPRLHANDTVTVGGGLSSPHIAGVVADAAAARIEWLTSLGARFDTAEDGTVALGREAGHRQRRIVHADGDATGAEVMRTLVTAVTNRPDIVVREQTAAIDLVRRGNRVAGVAVRDIQYAPDAAAPSDNVEVLTADAVVLATGGIGRLYAHTTNPAEATGDGLAMARRAGAQIQNPEFVQFHPTALDSTLDPMPLLTEALRGEGAQLVDASGRRYVVDVHPDAELAPRDVVARANWHEQQSGPIYLDVRMIDQLAERFPTVHRYAVQAGLDPVRQLPVSPAQHYHMGGVATDDAGRTSLEGLYACGEVAATGLHGANRLASNSLIEGLVLGRRVAHAIATANPAVAYGGLMLPTAAHELLATAPEDPDATALAALRQLMWLQGGLVRDATGLTSALNDLPDLAAKLDRSVEGRNLVDVAEVVLRAALAREESRGSHYRRDYPTSGAAHGEHTVLVRPEPTTALEVAEAVAL